jgi:hypothetical protein
VNIPTKRKNLDPTGAWRLVSEAEGERYVEHHNEGLAENLALCPDENGIDIIVDDGPHCCTHRLVWEDLEQLADAVRWLWSERARLLGEGEVE